MPNKKTKKEKEGKKIAEESKEKAEKDKAEKTTEKKLTKKELEEKAKELEKKIEVKEIDIKKELGKSQKTEKKQENTLVPLEEYVKSGIHLGTRVITPNMRQYVYKRRADGLAVLNTKFIDEKLRQACDFISKFKPGETIIVCKREAGWRGVKLFSELTGIRAFTKKYPAGVITNLQLPGFFEPELVIICDPWLDRNALNDAKKINIKVLALCDTNNFVKDMDIIIPCNNKSNKSIGLVMHVLAREYLKALGIEKKIPSIEDFAGEDAG